MTVPRRRFLALGAAGAAGVGLTLLGSRQALATAEARGTAPTTRFAVGVRQYNWMRGSRKLTTYVYYPAKGTPGGNPITNAPVADGVFPVCEYSHGYGANPQGAAQGFVRPMAAAGFILPTPYFANPNIGDVGNGNFAKDVSDVITKTFALNTASGDPLAGHINAAAGIGVSGHSMGGMITHSLLTAWPDPRIVAAIPMSTVDSGNPSGRVRAKVMFMHGDKDRTCPISSAQQAYRELPSPKAFLTFRGADHGGYLRDARAATTYVDWMRWGLYDDTTARDRLRGDATSGTTTWETAF
jgi:fermentation-respiration switch protein FrsA (DUF1100 family)